MSFAILRTAKLKSAGEIGGSVAHTFRTRDTPNADPERLAQNEHLGPDTPDAVKAGIQARLPEKRRKDAVLCIEYFIGASPEAFQDNKGGDQYFRAAMDWLRERHGAENVISGHVHRDETSPHLVAYVVPRDGEKLNAKKWLGGKVTLSAMQTDFAEKVGRPFGLERGIEGSKAVHKTIREFYAETNALAKTAPARSTEVEAALSPDRQMLKKGLIMNKVETPEQAMARVVATAKREIAQAQKVTAQLQAEKRTWQQERKRMIAEAKKIRERFGDLLDVARKMPKEQVAKLAAGIRQAMEANAKARAAEMQRRRGRDRGGGIER